jgi:hypothetical protein
MSNRTSPETVRATLSVLAEAGPGEYPEARKVLAEALAANLEDYAERKAAIVAANAKATGRTLSDAEADEMMADLNLGELLELDEESFNRLNQRLIYLDEIADERPLTEAEKLEYFEAERAIFPANSMFRPENLEATKAKYLAR